MKISDIQLKLAALNGATPAAPKAKSKKKPAAAVVAAAPKADEILQMSAARIVAAFGLEKQGVTVDVMVAGVKAYEGGYAGRVM